MNAGSPLVEDRAGRRLVRVTMSCCGDTLHMIVPAKGNDFTVSFAACRCALATRAESN